MNDEPEILSNSDKPEYIICAAIWLNDGGDYPHQPKNIETGFVVCGRRHHNCIATAVILNKWILKGLKESSGKTVQGFLTSKDRFIDRREGGELALSQNQILEPTDCLFSEDLY